MRPSNSALFGAGLIALAAVGTRANEYNVVTQMYHNAGQASGDHNWSSNASGPGQACMTFGPYTRSFGAGTHLIYSWVTLNPPGPNTTVTARWDVTDANTGGGYHLDEVSATTYVKGTFLADYVTIPANTNLEVRTFNRGNGIIVQDSVKILSGRDDLEAEYWPTVAPYNYHRVGYAVGNLWTTTPGYGPGYMTFGPYFSTLRKGDGTYVVGFSLKLDALTPSNDKVATIEIASRKQCGPPFPCTPSSAVYVKASRVLYRSDFQAANKMQVFPLEFQVKSVPDFFNWEFRVYYHGKGTLSHGRTNLYKVNWNGG